MINRLQGVWKGMRNCRYGMKRCGEGSKSYKVSTILFILVDLVSEAKLAHFGQLEDCMS